MFTNAILLAGFAIVCVVLYTDGRTVSCRRCLDSEIITVVPSVAPCCLRHVRQKCGRAAHCDKGLTCRYPYRHAPTGYCKVPTGKPCKVNGTLYQHGTKFKLDCRTSCYCENGIYGCSSLCPQEQIPPTDVCDNPQLVDVPGQCCREWFCEPPPVDEAKFCTINSTNWDECSSSCGGGITYRESNTNSQCIMTKETRFCQKESCSGMRSTIEMSKLKHQLRRKHSCRATVRSPTSYLRIGPCSSVRSFHPRQCGACLSNDICCKPVRTATLKVEMQCGSLLVDEENNDIHKILMEYIIPGNDIWDPKDSDLYPTVPTESRISKKIRRSIFKKQLTSMFGNDTDIGEPKNEYSGEVRNSDPYDDENNLHFINMEWIIKCECKKEYCKKIDEDYFNYVDDSVNEQVEMIEDINGDKEDDYISITKNDDTGEETISVESFNTVETLSDEEEEDIKNEQMSFLEALDNDSNNVILHRVHRTARKTKPNNYY